MPSNSSATERADTNRGDRAAHVVVFAPARLHLGFLDLDGGLGRRFGGLGLTIDGFGTRLRMAPASAPAASGPGAARALRYLDQAAAALDLPQGVRITIDEGSRSMPASAPAPSSASPSLPRSRASMARASPRPTSPRRSAAAPVPASASAPSTAAASWSMAGSARASSRRR
jgi:hypothetical protein